MKRNTLFFLFFYFFTPLVLLGQSKIEVLGARTFEFEQRNGQQIRKLIGDVKLRQDNMLLFCDSAYQFEASNFVEAYKNVHIIVNDSLHIFGDVLKYDGNKKKAKVERNVRLYDNSMDLTTDEVEYDLQNNIAFYSKGGRILNNQNVLTSRYGYYNSRSKEFFFKKDVVLTSPEYTIKGDTLKQNTATNISYFLGPTLITTERETIYSENGYYNNNKDIAVFSLNAKLTSEDNILSADSLFFDRRKNFGKAYRNITLFNIPNEIEIHGNYGEMHQYKKQSFVTQKAYAKKLLDNKTDSMFLIADTIYSYQKDTTNKQRQLIKAYHQAQLLKWDMQSVCDSLVYNYDDSCISLFKRPIMWSGNNQISADTIQLFLNNNKIDSFHLISNSFLASRETAKDFNQVKGKNMMGNFKDLKINYLHVMANAQSIFYPRDDKDSSFIGVNVIDCSEMEFFFNNNKIVRCNFITEPQATLYPIGELKSEELKLKGFKWQKNRRPTIKSTLQYFLKSS